MKKILLNCDLGESFGHWQQDSDSKVMPLIDYANIACGFHAGDPLTMSKTVALAIKHNVTIGAHPSYPDLVGFGRRSITMTSDELIATITVQIGALQAICQSQQSNLEYVKPHGALYNDMMKDNAIFIAVCTSIAQLPQPLKLMIQALPDMQFYLNTAKSFGITLIFEAFADRHYQNNGLLVPRSQENAVIESDEVVCQRLVHYLNTGQLLSEHNQPLALNIDSLCVHGDNPAAIALVTQIRKQLGTH